MDFVTYYPLALRTAKTMPTLRDELRHCLFGLVTELGEFISEVKRMAIYDKPISDAMLKHMREEVGDVSWYIPVGMRSMGIGVDALHDIDPSMARYFTDLKELVIPGVLLTGVIAATLVELDDVRNFNGIDVGFLASAFSGLIHFVNSAAILLGTTGDQLRSDNIAKLHERFPGAFTNEAAEARADKGGLAHTSS